MTGGLQQEARPERAEGRENVSKKILVVNGPNLNMLGLREPDVYGTVTLAEIEQKMREQARELGVDIEFYQSNHEGDLIDCLQQAREEVDGVIINAGGLTHSSVALHDALKAVGVPAVEVHMSNIYRREEFRRHSLISPAVEGGVFGFGEHSYYLALQALSALMDSRRKGDEG